MPQLLNNSVKGYIDFFFLLGNASLAEAILFYLILPVPVFICKCLSKWDS